VIERQKEDERRARNAAIGKQYLHESRCVAYAEKLEAFLKSQDSSVNAFWSIDSRYLREDEGNCLTFYWHPKGIQHDFKVVAKIDGTLVFSGKWDNMRTVTLNEWRTNRQAIDTAFEAVYRNPEIWNQEYKNSFRV